MGEAGVKLIDGVSVVFAADITNRVAAVVAFEPTGGGAAVAAVK